MPTFIDEGHFVQRIFDFSAADLDVLAEYSGITEKSVRSALESLQRNYLIERINSINGGEIWKVYRIPPMSFKPEYLNRITADRFGKNFPNK